jgi:hypothetical protein
VTLEEIEKRQAKAVAFARNYLKDDDLANRLEDEDPADYASRKHLTISNPALNQRRETKMANDTKADLQDAIDQATQILSDAYAPESSREDLAAAVGDALDALSGDGGDDDDGDDDDLNDDDTYSTVG